MSCVCCGVFEKQKTCFEPGPIGEREREREREREVFFPPIPQTGSLKKSLIIQLGRHYPDATSGEGLNPQLPNDIVMTPRFLAAAESTVVPAAERMNE